MANKPQQTTLTMYGIKNCDTIKKPAAGWKIRAWPIIFTTTAPTA